MRPLKDFPIAARERVRHVLTDIDDSLTDHGRLTAAAYAALESLKDAGLTVIPITGRPAGWCDHIARMWPVDGVVGENGAFYFHYDHGRRAMVRRFWIGADERRRDRARLDALAGEILAAVPGAAIAADQPYREADLAIDVREDVAPLPAAAIDRIVGMFEAAGAQAKVSSIHVNGWFGDYDKLAMTRLLMSEVFNVDLDAERDRFVFVGDSPNDAPMFRHFPNAVGVANVGEFLDRLEHRPAWVTGASGGAGFAEVARALLAAR
ncbi:MAG: HAD-IIB family hydrolase [Rhodospirillales bacterium]|nr:HAD-IIB family hydrolase [Rhodospirillales bacterium]